MYRWVKSVTALINLLLCSACTRALLGLERWQSANKGLPLGTVKDHLGSIGGVEASRIEVVLDNVLYNTSFSRGGNFRFIRKFGLCAKCSSREIIIHCEWNFANFSSRECFLHAKIKY